MATAIQKAAAMAADQGASKTSSRTARKPAKKARKPATNPKTAEQALLTTKTESILKLLRNPKGAMISDLMKVTGWQAHSVRGFLSGTVKKKLGLNVVSERTDSAERRYRIADDTAA